MTQYEPEHLRYYAEYLENYNSQKETYEDYSALQNYEKRDHDRKYGEPVDPGELEPLEKAKERYRAIDAVQAVIREAEGWCNALRNPHPNQDDLVRACNKTYKMADQAQQLASKLYIIGSRRLELTSGPEL